MKTSTINYFQRLLIIQFLCLVLMGITHPSFAQGCSYSVDELDKVTNKVTKITKKKTVWDVPFASEGKMSLSKIGDEYSVGFFYENAFGGTGGFIVNQNAELSFQLEDGTDIKLLKVKDGYPITKEQLDQMLKSKVVLIRFYYTELKTGTYTHPSFYKPDGKQAGHIQNLVHCVY
jgi:hypothetical protein